MTYCPMTILLDTGRPMSSIRRGRPPADAKARALHIKCAEWVLVHKHSVGETADTHEIDRRTLFRWLRAVPKYPETPGYLAELAEESERKRRRSA
jgi:hypothetical protein